MLEQRGTPGPTSLQAEPQNPFISEPGSTNISRHFLRLACRQPADVSSRSSSMIWGKKKKKYPKTIKVIRDACRFAYHYHTPLNFPYPLTTPKIGGQSEPTRMSHLLKTTARIVVKQFPLTNPPLPSPNLSQDYIALKVCKLGSSQSHLGVRMQSWCSESSLSSLTLAFITSILIWLTHPADPRVCDTSGLHREQTKDSNRDGGGGVFTRSCSSAWTALEERKTHRLWDAQLLPKRPSG